MILEGKRAEVYGIVLRFAHGFGTERLDKRRDKDTVWIQVTVGDIRAARNLLEALGESER